MRGTDLNPGKAANVGDESISGGTVDDLVEAACEYTEAIRKEQGSGTEPTQAVANLRTSVTRQLIQGEVTQAAMDELGLASTSRLSPGSPQAASSPRASPPTRRSC